MKKIAFLLLASSLVLFSCNKNNDKNPTPFKLEGVWEITRFATCDVPTHPEPGEEQLCDSAVNVGTITFNEDGNGNFSFNENMLPHSYPETFAYTYTNHTLEMEYLDLDYDFSEEYTLTEDGNKMKMVNIYFVNSDMSWITTFYCSKRE